MNIARKIEKPAAAFGELDADGAARLVMAASDIALVIDSNNIITDISFLSDELSRLGCDRWIGQPWIETVTLESRAKVEDVLREARSSAFSRPREINQPTIEGPDLPVRYSAVRVGSGGQVVAVGRDLRTVAALQRRLVIAQQSMEREYARARQTETRYRLLFHVTTEGVIIVDGATERVMEVNPAAASLIGHAPKKIAGRPVACTRPSASR